MTIENHQHDIELVTSWARKFLGDAAVVKLGLEKSRYNDQGWIKIAKCIKGRCDGVLIANGDTALMRRLVETTPNVIRVERAPGLLEGKWGILVDFEPLKDTKEYSF